MQLFIFADGQDNGFVKSDILTICSNIEAYNEEEKRGKL